MPGFKQLSVEIRSLGNYTTNSIDSTIITPDHSCIFVVNGYGSTNGNYANVFVFKDYDSVNNNTLANILAYDITGSGRLTVYNESHLVGNTFIYKGSFITSPAGGSRNETFGFNAFTNAPLGANDNIALGYYTMWNKTSGTITSNIAIGNYALTNGNYTTTNNIVVGHLSADAFTSPGFYTFSLQNALVIGNESLILKDSSVVSSSGNLFTDIILIGHSLASQLSGHSGSVQLGSKTIAIGKNNIQNRFGNSTIVIGFDTLTITPRTSENNIVIGNYSANTYNLANYTAGEYGIRDSIVMGHYAVVQPANVYRSIVIGRNISDRKINHLNQSIVVGYENISNTSVTNDINNLTNNVIIGYDNLKNFQKINNIERNIFLGRYIIHTKNNNPVREVLNISDNIIIGNYTFGYNSYGYTGNSQYNIAIGNNNFIYISDKLKYNIAIGHYAAQKTTSFYSIAIGNFSLSNFEKNQPPSDSSINYSNISIGNYSLYSCETGVRNVSLGNYAAYGTTTGSYNISIGYQALQSNTTSSNNLAIGDYSLNQLISGNGNNIAIGNRSLQNSNTSLEDTISIGYYAGLANGGNKNILIGNYVAPYLSGTSSSNVIIGYQAAKNKNNTFTSPNVIENVILGSNAISELNGNTSSISGSVFVGFNTGLYAISGSDSVVIGHNAFCTYSPEFSSNPPNSNLQKSIIVGSKVAQKITNISNSICIGDCLTNDGWIGYNPQKTIQNQIVIGNLSIYDIYTNESNNGNVVVGNDSLTYARGLYVDDNFIFGNRCLPGVVGDYAGNGNYIYRQNICVGSKVLENSTGIIDNNIGIGFGVLNGFGNNNNKSRNISRNVVIGTNSFGFYGNYKEKNIIIGNNAFLNPNIWSNNPSILTNPHNIKQNIILGNEVVNNCDNDLSICIGNYSMNYISWMNNPNYSIVGKSSHSGENIVLGSYNINNLPFFYTFGSEFRRNGYNIVIGNRILNTRGSYIVTSGSFRSNIIINTRNSNKLLQNDPEDDNFIFRNNNLSNFSFLDTSFIQNICIGSGNIIQSFNSSTNTITMVNNQTTIFRCEENILLGFENLLYCGHSTLNQIIGNKNLIYDRSILPQSEKKPFNYNQIFGTFNIGKIIDYTGNYSDLNIERNIIIGSQNLNKGSIGFDNYDVPPTGSMDRKTFENIILGNGNLLDTSNTSSSKNKIIGNRNIIIGNGNGVTSDSDGSFIMRGNNNIIIGNGLTVSQLSILSGSSSTINDNIFINIVKSTSSTFSPVVIDTVTKQVFFQTSSIKYKKDIEDISDVYGDEIYQLRPVWYRSKLPSSEINKHWSWYGFIAEEVAQVDPRFVCWGYDEQEDYETIETVITNDNNISIPINSYIYLIDATENIYIKAKILNDTTLSYKTLTKEYFDTLLHNYVKYRHITNQTPESEKDDILNNLQTDEEETEENGWVSESIQSFTLLNRELSKVYITSKNVFTPVFESINRVQQIVINEYTNTSISLTIKEIQDITKTRKLKDGVQLKPVSINYSVFTPHLVYAVKKQKSHIEQLEQTIVKLQSQISGMQNVIDDLQDTIQQLLSRVAALEN